MLQGINIGKQFPEAALRTAGNIRSIPVDQTVGQQEHLHAQSSGDQVLFGIVADHQAFLRPQTQPVQNILKIGRIGFAVPGIFVGGVQLKILRLQTCPAGAVFRGNGREQGIGGQNDVIAFVPDGVNRFCSFGIEAAGCLCIGEFLCKPLLIFSFYLLCV